MKPWKKSFLDWIFTPLARNPRGSPAIWKYWQGENLRYLTRPTADLHWQLQCCFCTGVSKNILEKQFVVSLFSCIIYKVIFWVSHKTGKISVIEIENKIMYSLSFPLLSKSFSSLWSSAERKWPVFLWKSASALCGWTGNSYCEYILGVLLSIPTFTFWVL